MRTLIVSKSEKDNFDLLEDYEADHFYTSENFHYPKINNKHSYVIWGVNDCDQLNKLCYFFSVFQCEVFITTTCDKLPELKGWRIITIEIT